jgi:hypothetical protein
MKSRAAGPVQSFWSCLGSIQHDPTTKRLPSPEAGAAAISHSTPVRRDGNRKLTFCGQLFLQLVHATVAIRAAV